MVDSSMEVSGKRALGAICCFYVGPATCLDVDMLNVSGYRYR